MGVTKSLLRIPLLLYSTTLKPEPAILKFMIIKANNPGRRKSIYLCGLAFTSFNSTLNKGEIFLIFLSMEIRDASIAF